MRDGVKNKVPATNFPVSFNTFSFLAPARFLPRNFTQFLGMFAPSSYPVSSKIVLVVFFFSSFFQDSFLTSLQNQSTEFLRNKVELGRNSGMKPNLINEVE